MAKQWSTKIFRKKIALRYVISSLALLQPALVAAQVTTQPADGIADIVVTAQKRATSLQKTPLSVTALGSDFVEQARVYAASDITKYVPNVQFREAATTAERNFVIRGIGTATSSVGVEGSVGVVVDNVVLGREGAGVSGFSDIERIEVLRGPQGTLFGKNASAGVINIITRKPSLTTFSGQAQASYGNANAYRVSGYVNGPIADGLGVHLSAFASGNDGFERSVIDGKRVNGPQQYGVRAKLLYQLSDALSVELLGDYGKANGHCCQWSLDKVVPGTLQDVLVRQTGLAAIGPKSRQTYFEITPQDNSSQGGISGEINWIVGEHTLTSITAYREWHQDDLVNPDYLPGIIYVLNTSRNIRRQHQTSEELRLASPSGERLTYVFGLFYFGQKIDLSNDRRGFGLYGVSPQNTVITLVPQNPDLASRSLASDSTQSYAAFGDATFKATDKLSALLGLRYSYETKSASFSRFTLPGAPGFHPGFPPGSFTIDDMKDHGFTYRVGLQYDWTDSIMTFATYSTGHKGKGVDLNAGLVLAVAGVPVPASAHAVKAENVRNFEAGIRSTLFDRKLQLNLTGFTTIFKNYQGTAFVPAAVVQALQSVPEIKNDGVELEAIISPMRYVRISGNAAYLNSRYTDFANAPCYVLQTAALGCVGGVQNLKGAQVPRAPKYSYSLGLTYEPKISGRLTATFAANYAWQDSITFGIDDDPNQRIKGYGTLDLSVGVRTADRKYEATLWGKNVLDKQYVNFMFAQFGGPGNYAHYLAAPATYGVSFLARF